jgi:hypothetical protein
LALEEIVEGKATGRRLFTNPKTNVAEEQRTIAYRMEVVKVGQDHTGEPITAPRIVWGGVVDITGDQALAATSEKTSPASALKRAEAFLRRALANGPVPVEQLKTLAAIDTHTWSTVKDAKRTLGIVHDHDGFGPGSAWTWAMPPDDGS